MHDDPLDRLPTHQRTLDNGLTVLVREDHSAPVVAVVTHVKAGYFDEPDDIIGISHVLEHMYFKGTARRGAGEIAQETKAAGGYLNAGTIYDRTSYYTVLPSASLEQALDIQADALQRSAIDDDELRKELLVIIQEAKRKLDNPASVAQESLFETMFDVHRMRRWRIGTESMLQGFTRDDVWQYYRNLYRAANTIVVVAGDVEAERVFALAEQHYGAMPAGEAVRSNGAEEPVRRELRYREMSGDVGQSYMEWGWRTPGTLHADTPALDVLSIALGSGRASRLYRHVRDEGLVAAASSYNYTPTTIGVFGIGAELRPQDTDAAFRRIAHVLHDVLRHGFTDAEVERARNILEARLLRRLETVEGQADMLASWQALGDWRRAGEYRRAAMGVSAGHLLDVARRYLDPDAVTVLLYRPAEAPQFAASADDIRPLLSAPAGDLPRSEVVTTYRVPVIAAPMRADRVDDGVHFYVVDGGRARIVIKPRNTAPLVSMALYCRGGILAETDANAGLTGLMTRTSVKGTRTRSALQLAEESEALGGSVGAGAGADMLDWVMSVPARHFAHGLDLLLDTALEPAFDEQEAERERKIALSDLEQLRDDMHNYPIRLALSAAFDGHPYGTGLETIQASLRAADLQSLHGWHRDRVLRGAPYIFVVGDVADPDTAAALIAARLHGHLEEPLGLGTSPAGWPGAGATRVETRDKAQTAIALAFPGPPRNHPDVYPLQLLSSAISGLGGRLFEELRSRRSLAYSVSAAPMARWLGGAFIAYIGTAPEREEEARAELVRELVRVTEELLEPQELERARRYMIGAWQIRQQTHGRQLADLAHALLLGEGLAELRQYEHRIASITAEQVREAAARWIVPAHMVEGVVRGTGGAR